MGNVHPKKELSRKAQFYLLSLIPIYFIAAGLIVQQEAHEQLQNKK